MSWRLVNQTEWIGDESYEVLCKRLRSYPREDKRSGAIIGYGWIPRSLLILQVVVQSPQGVWHRLKVIRSRFGTKYVWQHPDRMEHPKIKIGARKSGRRHSDTRQEILDVLTPKRRVAGQKVEFSSKTQFSSHLIRVLGEPPASEILELFARQLQSVPS